MRRRRGRLGKAVVEGLCVAVAVARSGPSSLSGRSAGGCAGGLFWVAPSVGLPLAAVRGAVRLVVVLMFVSVLLPVVAARADSPSTLTVVGTSDVQDSGLMPELIRPMFQKAYPAFTL